MEAMIGKPYRWSLQRVGPSTEMATLILNNELVVIGRSKEATHKLKSVYLSRIHATLRFYNDNWMLKDSGSINGTYVNNHRLNPDHDHPLDIGDIIGFGMPFIEPITENSVIYRFCREEVDTATVKSSTSSAPPCSPQQQVQVAAHELPELDNTVCNPAVQSGKSRINSANSDLTNTTSSSQQQLPDCSITMPRCDSKLFAVPNGVNWENCKSSANPAKVKLENDISYENSSRKMKVTPHRVVIDLCDSDDEIEEEKIKKIVDGKGICDNAGVTDNLGSTTGKVLLPVIMDKTITTAIVNKLPHLPQNQTVKPVSVQESTAINLDANLVDGSLEWSFISKVQEVPACPEVQVECTGSFDKTKILEELSNDGVSKKISENVENLPTDISNDISIVSTEDSDAEMNDNFGYSQEDEVIVISDDESYFSQKSIVKEMLIKEEAESDSEDVIKVENDDWATVFQARQRNDLDEECADANLDVLNTDCDSSPSMEIDTSNLDQPGPSGLQPQPMKDLDCSVHKDSDQFEQSDFFPILSQTFDTSSDESDNEHSSSVVRNSSGSKELNEEGGDDQTKAYNSALHTANKFYKQSKVTVYDRLKRKSGDEVPFSIKATRLTQPKPLLPMRLRKNLDQPIQTPAKIVSTAKVALSHVSASDKTKAVPDKTKNRGSLRDRMQQKMGHRIPHPGGGSAIPAGPKAPIQPQQKKTATRSVSDKRQIKSAKPDKPFPVRGMTSCSSVVNAALHASNCTTDYSRTQNDMIFSGPSALPAFSEGSSDTTEAAESLQKGKSAKVPQRNNTSRSDMFAAALQESDSRPVSKRKSAPQKSVHPAKKANTSSESKENAGKVADRSKSTKSKQTIFLSGDFNGLRPDMMPEHLLAKSAKPNTTGEKKSNRNVRFSDNVTTYVIERVTLEADIPHQPLEDGGNMDFFQHRPEVVTAVNRNRDICLSWKSSWLHEQENCQYPPPLLKNKPLKKTVKSYASHKEYVDVFEPLLFYELWDIISSDWRQRRTSLPNFPLVLNRVEEDSHSSSRPQFFLLHCHVLVNENEEKFGQYPQEGWLTILEVPNTIADGTGRSSVLRLFAYVESCNKTSLHFLQRDGRLSPLLRELASRCKSKVSFVLKLMLRTKYLNIDISLDRPLNVELISYIRPHLRLFQALHFVPCLPLGMQILSPHQKLCTMPSFPHSKKLIHVGSIMYNSLQRRAIMRITEAVVVDKSPKICLIQGPPGTGKTSLVVGLIVQLLFGSHIDECVRRPQILLCAASNNAVDEDLRRLLELREALREKGGLKAVRVGQNEGMHMSVRPYSLENIIRYNIENHSGPDALRREINDLTTNINRKQQEFDTLVLRKKTAEANKIATDIRRLKNLREETSKLLEDWYHMTPEEYQRQCIVWREGVLLKADVIATTLGSCTQHGMEVFFRRQQNPFICIIDEATQCTEPEVLLPLQFGVNKLVLIGDPQQLPSTVKSLVAKEKRLSLSLFERLDNTFRKEGSHPAIVLETQYRMHPELCAYPSKAFYKSKLKTDSVLVKKLDDVPFVPYVVFDVADSAEETTGKGDICNTKEAIIVTKLCEALLLKCSQYNIGVITFYSHQKRCLTERLQASNILQNKAHHIEINTVDGFQGREKDVIIMSTVRAKSANGGIGFVNDQRRLNVAITRGRYSLYICGHLTSLKVSEHWRNLIQDALFRKKIQKVSSMISLPALQDLVLKS